jgi:hypothetical protein
MDERRTRIFVAIAGILGVVLLSGYFAAPFPQPPANATAEQIAETANKYSTLLLIGGWLQITGTLLAAVFFIGLVYLARAITRLADMLTLFAAAVLLSTSLLEATLLMNVAYATANGHPQTALNSWDLMTMFIHVFPIGPAPLSYLSLGALLLGTALLPRLFGYLALLLGAGFALVGLLGLLVPAVNVGIIALLIAQELWILAAGITLLFWRGYPSIESNNVATDTARGSMSA